MARKKRKKTADFSTLQIKPIFAVAPVVHLDDGEFRFVVRLEQPVSSNTEVYLIRKVMLNDGTDGDLSHPPQVVVQQGNNHAEFRATPTRPGWVFLRFTEQEQHGQVLGAVFILPGRKRRRRRSQPRA